MILSLFVCRDRNTRNDSVYKKLLNVVEACYKILVVNETGGK